MLHQAGSYGKAAIIPKIGDLKELVEEEGYVGEYFEPGDVEGMTSAVVKLLTDHDYRKSLGMINYTAAASLPMNDIADWYLMHFERLLGIEAFSEDVFAPKPHLSVVRSKSN